MGRNRRGGGTKQAAVWASSFDAAQPAAFYLLDEREVLESLADAVLSVEGVELPVHSQVLSLQSKVLLDMFATVSRPSGQGGQARAVLREPFAGCSLFEVALFLRFMYHPADLTPANLAAVRGSLLGLLRLAHKLDAPRIMNAVARQMSGCVGTTLPQRELLAWAEVAQQCQLLELQLACLTEVASQLSCADNLASAFSSATALTKCCDHSTLALLLGMLAAACGPTSAPRLRSITPAAAAEALEASANHGSFEWAIDRFSQLPAAVGRNKYSPYFQAAGIDWRFNIFPGGDGQEAAGELSAYIVPKQGGFTAKYAITVVDQGPTKQDLCLRADDAKAFETQLGWGWRKFATTAKLRSPSNGYLKGDRLLLRATVEVVERKVLRV